MTARNQAARTATRTGLAILLHWGERSPESGVFCESSTRWKIATMAVDITALELELLESVILAIPSPPDLVAFASTCHTLRTRIEASAPLWRQLTVKLLGEPLVALHRTAWGVSGDADALFYRRLFRVAYCGGEVCHANTLRRAITADFSDDGLANLICATGHTANVCGHLVCVIGGWRPKCPQNHLHAYVVDVVERKMHRPALCAGSATPGRRLRHSSCVVETPRWAHLPAGAPPLPSILVLGGYFDGGGKSELDDEMPLERGDLALMTLL